MRINPAILIQKVLDFSDVFVKLLDEIDANGGAYEIREHVYIELYSEHIANSGDDKAKAWLSLDSMIKNNLFVHNNRRSNTIIIQHFLIDEFRYIDVKRSRQLSESDFESIRVRMKLLESKILSSDGPGDPNYDEAMISFNELMSETLTKVSRNKETLNAHKDSIGELITSRSNGEHSSIKPEDVFNAMVRIFERFVIPFQEFMNPVLELKGRGEKNFWKLIQSIIIYHTSIDRQDIATTLGYRKASIFSYYKDTNKIVESFRDHYEFMSRDREKHLAIEAAFGTLMKDLSSLRHGKLTNKYFNEDSSMLEYGGCLKGLSNLRAGHSQKLNWHKELTPLRYEEWERVTESKPRKTNLKNLEHVPPTKKSDNDRKKKLVKLCVLKKWPTEIVDIHKYIHEWLSSEIEDYNLYDLLTALGVLISDKRERIVHHRHRCRLDDGTYYIDYLMKSI